MSEPKGPGNIRRSFPFQHHADHFSLCHSIFHYYAIALRNLGQVFMDMGDALDQWNNELSLTTSSGWR